MAVDHITQMAFTDIVILMPIREVVLRQLQDQRYKDKQLLHSIFCNMTLKSLDLSTMLVDDIRLFSLEFRDCIRPLVLPTVLRQLSVRLTEFEHVVHFDVVSLARKYFARSFGSISIVISMFQVRAVLYFLLSGKREELLAYGELTIDFFLGQTKVGNIEKAHVVNCIFELCCKLLLAPRSIKL